MMIKEIRGKTLLAHIKEPDPWFGLKYNMNIYRGCQHQCIYCDSRSECYQIEDFRDVLVKVNAVELLRQELPRKRVKGTIGTGSMSDPYGPVEREYGLMGQALQVIAACGYPVHIITKSDLVLRDLEQLVAINKVYAAVSFTLTTVDDELARKLEPGAPLPSARLAAMERLAQAGVYTGVTMMPVLPFITDGEDQVRELVRQAALSGAKYIIPWLGMSLRDRQRAYYYTQLDLLFPGIRQQYETTFRNRYRVDAINVKHLWQVFIDCCTAAGLQTVMAKYAAEEPHNQQLSLF